ncbi:MAG TPA: M20/M25/M40 family metallo-hydrolase, partial [Lentisphaeria bacterium]|nr:M20/M25/M40 family metallo-hydrolase [Lentisphaeria bacterium]
MPVLEELVPLLCAMIRIDSRNTLPLGAPGERTANEEDMGNFVAERLTALGFAVEKQYIAPLRPNVIGSYHASDSYPTLVLNAHLDTVGSDGMTIPPLDPQIRDQRIYGRGACDTKGSLAAMLKACERMIADKLPLNLIYLATSAEETSCQGSPFVDLSRWQVDGILVGEPTMNRPVIAHKCHGTLELVCRGRAAHGSRPELGDNAIFKMGKLLAHLENTVIPELAAITYPGFTNGCTLSVGLIKGGAKSNIVPDECRITCDIRLVPKAGEPEDIFQRLADGATAALGFPVEIGHFHSAPAMQTAPDHPFTQAVLAGVAAAGVDATPLTVTYCTDGGQLSKKGHPCIVLGPGDISVAHAAVEYLEIAQLEQAVDVYVSIGRTMATKR